ncbi:MAG TPA: hypothetical protein VJ842_08780 [Pyrinomonadaceae bacterium]|nr:hypothetical protein [Pyrinomonadaceae bacterium]
MRTIVLSLTCGAALLASAACGSPSSTTNNTNSGAANNGNASARTSDSGAIPPVSSAHGGTTTATSPAAAPASTTSGGASKPSIDTAALDAKIEKAEAKAKAGGATQADKLAAAAALLERANVYRDAGQPALYKFALGDYRRALRYQPDNAEAREKMNEIVSIYQSMGRPVPTNGSDPIEP